jgi:PAS domain-containing protein
MDHAGSDAYWDEAPVLFDVLTSTGIILHANSTETQMLGFEPGGLQGRNADCAYTAASLKILKTFFENAARGEPAKTHHVRLSMWTKNLEKMELFASLNVTADRQHGFIMRLVKFQSGSDLERLARLESDNEVLTGIVETAQDATYCIEFQEPVDLTAPEHEIIRQVFENACRWRYCNDAMARLYRLPPGEDPNKREVREIFPRNSDNESFVQTLIEAGWHVNAAPSRDHRYDGADMFVNNDVRAHIVEGRLLRFWGVIRDQSSRILKERQLRADADHALDLLGAVPDQF